MLSENNTCEDKLLFGCMYIVYSEKTPVLSRTQCAKIKHKMAVFHFKLS